MASAAGSARLADGNNRTANNWNPNSARARRRRNLNDMFYPGALTSRLKRYAAEPAPDEAKLTLISERTANVARETSANRLRQTRVSRPQRFPEPVTKAC